MGFGLKLVVVRRFLVSLQTAHQAPEAIQFDVIYCFKNMLPHDFTICSLRIAKFL
jgi:hypothetical protein